MADSSFTDRTREKVTHSRCECSGYIEYLRRDRTGSAKPPMHQIIIQ